MKLFTTELKKCKNGTNVALNHLIDVIKARKEAGLPVVDYTVRNIDHELVGRRILDTVTGDEYTIKSCTKHWYWGWCYGFTIQQDSGTGTFIYWCQDTEKPSCYDIIRESIKDNHDKFEVLPTVT